MNDRSRALYRAFSLALVIVFALVGAIFLFMPEGTLGFFNSLSRRWGLAEGPAERSFFGVLAVAYMYVVTVLAWLMYRSPGEKIYPLLLGQAKAASSVLSFLMFAFDAPRLVYLANGVVDGLLAIAVPAFFFKVRAASRGGSS